MEERYCLDVLCRNKCQGGYKGEGSEERREKKKFAFLKGAILGAVSAHFPVSCPGFVAVSLISFSLYNF